MFVWFCLRAFFKLFRISRALFKLFRAFSVFLKSCPNEFSSVGPFSGFAASLIPCENLTSDIYIEREREKYLYIHRERERGEKEECMRI